MKKQSLSITMETVAREVNLSRATVSRVLSGSPTVNEAYRKRVLAACDRLGYIRNDMATQLAKHRSDTVGLLLRNTANPGYAHLHDHILHASYKRGMFVTTMSAGKMHHHHGEEERLRRLMQIRPGGIFIATGLIPSKDILPFSSQLPIVVLARPEQTKELHNIGYNDHEHGRMIAEFVARKGHQKVAVVLTPSSISWVENIRACGMIERLDELGVKVVRIRGKAIMNNPLALAERIVSGARKKYYTAAMFPNDVKALDFIANAQNLGYSIPEDIGVSGMDGMGVCSTIVGLATVRMPMEEICEAAADLMSDLMTNGFADREPVQQYFTGHVIGGKTL